VIAAVAAAVALATFATAAVATIGAVVTVAIITLTLVAVAHQGPQQRIQRRGTQQLGLATVLTLPHCSIKHHMPSLVLKPRMRAPDATLQRNGLGSYPRDRCYAPPAPPHSKAPALPLPLLFGSVSIGARSWRDRGAWRLRLRQC
jgi:hypothetical protein